MMTTPRVTELEIAMAAVEPDPFIDGSARASIVQRRISEREARLRRTELVRRVMRMRAKRHKRGG